MAYNMNTDYMAIMNANAKGSAAYNAAEASRNEKIAAMNAAGTNTNRYIQTQGGVAIPVNTQVNNTGTNTNGVITGVTNTGTNTNGVITGVTNTGTNTNGVITGVTNTGATNTGTQPQSIIPAGVTNKTSDSWVNTVTTGQNTAPIVPQPVQQPVYQSKYSQGLQDLYDTLFKRINGTLAYDPNTDAALKAAQLQAQDETAKQAARRGMLYSDSNKYQMGQAAMELVPQFQQLAQETENRKIANMLSLLQGAQEMEGMDYTKFKDALNRSDTMNELQGYVTDSKGNLVKTSDQTQRDLENTLAAQTKAENDYKSTMSRFKNDYQAEINRVQNDGDTSNDWQIPLLQTARQEKIDKQVESEINTIGQYANDYQAEINRRSKINPSDPLIPYLKIARLAKMTDEQAKKASALEYQQKLALEKWQMTGKADKSIASILGVPEGSKTLDYIQTAYEVGRPYYKPDSSGSGSVSSKDANDTYNGYLNIFASNPAINSNTGRTNIEDAAREILFGTDAQKILGKNFDNIAFKAQQAYANQVRNDWNDMDSLGKELNRTSNLNPDTPMPANQYYKRMLGQYYNDLAY